MIYIIVAWKEDGVSIKGAPWKHLREKDTD